MHVYHSENLFHNTVDIIYINDNTATQLIIQTLLKQNNLRLRVEVEFKTFTNTLVL